MSDFPRGWTLSSYVAGGLASITVPAIAGVVHVLDSFTGTIYNTAASTAELRVVVSSSDGVFASLPLAELVAAATNGSDSGGGSGLDLAAGPGASLTIAFNGSATGINEFLLVQGHDI